MASAVTAAEGVDATAAPAAPSRSQRPAWLPAFIPSFDGLRGIAILAVLLYHCLPRLQGTFLEKFVAWGWAGVSLFFVLSGFLITGIILDSGSAPRFYSNFYARRFLRIWPVYWMLLFLNYFFFPLLFSGYRWMVRDVTAAPWLYLLLFVQNLWSVALPGTLGPTWSLAIEEQFYLAWTPIVRCIPPRWLLLAASTMLVTSPVVRLFFGGHFTPTNTLTHLDGLAVGSLLAIALRVLPWPPHGMEGDCPRRSGRRSRWRRAHAPPRLRVHRHAARRRIWRNVADRPARPRSASSDPLPARTHFSAASVDGKVSYSLYLTHILVFSILGNYVDKPLERFGIPGNLAIVAIRLAASIGVAALCGLASKSPSSTLSDTLTSARFTPNNKAAGDIQRLAHFSP